MDGANMNAHGRTVRPAEIGADVCHLNLHKTFCIPHGGGGPGMGPIGVPAHLAPFLPGHPRSSRRRAMAGLGGALRQPEHPADLLGLHRDDGRDGLTRATEIAILNANYMARGSTATSTCSTPARTAGAPTSSSSTAAPSKSRRHHVEDVAKRLMDYGFHAPTMSLPVAGTLMIEPTESETRAELDRFCDAMISIRAEIEAIEDGTADREDNVLKNAPHSAHAVTGDALGSTRTPASRRRTRRRGSRNESSGRRRTDRQPLRRPQSGLFVRGHGVLRRGLSKRARAEDHDASRGTNGSA